MEKLRENKGTRATGMIGRSLRFRIAVKRTSGGETIVRIVGESPGIIYRKSAGRFKTSKPREG